MENQSKLKSGSEHYLNRRHNLFSILRIWDLGLAVALAFVIFLATAYVLIDRFEVLPLATRRIISVSRFLKNTGTSRPRPVIFGLGSSRLHEGVDGKIVDEVGGGGFEFFNLGWSHGVIEQQVLVLPLVVKANPDGVVLFVDVDSLAQRSEIPRHLLNTADWWRLLGPADLKAFPAILGPDECHILAQGRVKTLLDFRSLPLDTLDLYVREDLRLNLAERRHVTNFKDPWIRRETVGATSASHRYLPEGAKAIIALETVDYQINTVLDEIIDYLHGDRSRRVIICFTPINPAQIAIIEPATLWTMAESLRSLGDRTGSDFLDYSRILGPEDFRDLAHANAAGRAKFSDRLGRDLAQRLSRGKSR